MQLQKNVPMLPWPTIINILSELVVFDHYEFHAFLEKLIQLILQIIPVNSCLIYFMDDEKKQLTLIASNHEDENMINQLSLHIGEGITGWVAQNKKTVAIFEKAYKDPQFKFFAKLREDTYESFLSVPIINETGVIGVINLQNQKSYTFSAEEIITIEAITKIIAAGFAKIMLQKKITQLSDKLAERKLIEKAKGVLMKIKNISEQDAFRFLRTESMNKRKSMKEIAEAILLIWE